MTSPLAALYHLNGQRSPWSSLAGCGKSSVLCQRSSSLPLSFPLSPFPSPSLFLLLPLSPLPPSASPSLSSISLCFSLSPLYLPLFLPFSPLLPSASPSLFSTSLSFSLSLLYLLLFLLISPLFLLYRSPRPQVLATDRQTELP